MLTHTSTPARPVDVTVTDVGFRTTRVAVSGDLDLDATAQLGSVMTDQLARGRRYVRLDLACVEFVDCAGVGGLLRMHYRFLDARGTVILTGLSKAVARLLRLTGVDEILFLGDAPREPRHVSAAATATAVGVA